MICDKPRRPALPVSLGEVVVVNRRRKKGSLVDRAVEQIRSLINRNGLGPGDPLPSTAEMGKRFDVSRTVLREAVSRLESVGLVRVAHGRGVFVGAPDAFSKCLELIRSAVSISRRELVQLTEFRRGIECQAARLAARRARPGDVAALLELCDQMDRPGQDDMDSLHYDLAFHMKIAEMSSNDLTRNVIDVIQQFVLAGMSRTTPRPRDWAYSRRLHRAIVDAIHSGDPDAAEKAMVAHMDAVTDRLLDIGEDE
jgi:GntR family transcriptional repressor for pyruvate dehydrogenase complex